MAAMSLLGKEPFIFVKFPTFIYQMLNHLLHVARLHRDSTLLKLPPYLSAICLLVGLVWLLLLPLDEYSRKTYVSENALLPGQVHTYFSGSEHNIFRAYRHEVASLVPKSIDEYVVDKLLSAIIEAH